VTASSFERLPLFKRRPALTILLAIAVGISFANTSEDPPTLLRFALPAFVALLCITFFLRKQPLLLFLCTFVSAVVFGIVLMTASLANDERSLLAKFGDTKVEQEIALVGKVDEVRETDHLYIRLKCDSLIAGGKGHALEKEAAGIFLRPGDDAKKIALRRRAKVKVFGELSSFAAQRNPYAFDYDRYLSTTEGINALMFCDSYYDITILGYEKPTLYDHVIDFFAELRVGTKNALSELVSDTVVRGFILAMVLGERKALPDTIWEDFQQAGLSHILVVSGFNLGLIAWALYIILRLLRLGRREVRIVLVMIGTLFYGLLVGPQSSVIRAVIVVELILLSRLLERKSDLVNVTAGAALIDLVFAPGDLFNVSFQLSYGAVFALTLIAPALDRYFFPDPEKPRSRYVLFLKGAIGTTAVLIGTLPIVLFHFHQVSIISILTNVLTIPLASLATILSVLILPLAAISSMLASLYVDAIGIIIYSIRAIAAFAKEIPFAVIRLPHPSGIFSILYVLGVLYTIRAATRKAVAGRIAVIAMLGFSLTNTGFGLTSVFTGNGALSVIFFDVGQGDAALITTPNGKHYLVDAGGITRTGKSIAERAILPFLAAEQITRIDGTFATHMHLDHYGGLAQIIEECSVDTLYACGGKTTASYARTLDSIVFEKRVPISDLGMGTVLRLDDEVTAYVLNPDNVSQQPTNERSLVMKIIYRNTSILLLADIPAEIEEALVSQYGAFLKSDIVKVAHHGSLSSSSPMFIEQAHPHYAIISCGRRNRHGHPHKEIVERWQAGKATIARTDDQGALIFRSDGLTFDQVDWR
jgi:competence protein ComEC